ncbi:MAG: permease [Candidatus Aenigmatarchaeota archaeon]
MTLFKKPSGSWLFLCGVCALYVLAFLARPEIFYPSVSFFYGLVLKILPIFALVFVMMALVNYFVSPESIASKLEKRKKGKWLIAIVGGILSTGPIYMWYPLLADLKKKGVNYGLIACFLYNRAIKIPLLPVMILYFSWQYIFILTLVMVAASVLQGLLIERLMDGRNLNLKNPGKEELKSKGLRK